MLLCYCSCVSLPITQMRNIEPGRAVTFWAFRYCANIGQTCTVIEYHALCVDMGTCIWFGLDIGCIVAILVVVVDGSGDGVVFVCIDCKHAGARGVVVFVICTYK